MRRRRFDDPAVPARQAADGLSRRGNQRAGHVQPGRPGRREKTRQQGQGPARILRLRRQQGHRRIQHLSAFVRILLCQCLKRNCD